MAQREPLGLIHLPIELLDAVVALLDQPSHRALALTCRATNTSASEALYATYINRHAPSDAPFHLFLRTLCERPELAAMVRELDIRGWRSEFEVATGAKWQGLTKPKEQDKVRAKRTGPVFVSRLSSTRPKSLKLFEQTAVKIGLLSQDDTSSIPALKTTVILGSTLKKREDFARLLRHGVEDAQVVLMLSVLPNLARLSIDGMSAYPALDWHYFLGKSDTALRALRGVDICGQVLQDSDLVYSTTLSFLEFVPDLEHLHLSDISVETPRQITNLMSNKKLTCFSALEAQIDPQILRSMLSGQKLRNFQYKPGRKAKSETQVHRFSEDHIIDCLMESKQSLEKLTLYPRPPSKSPLLQQFDNLEFLEMPFAHGFTTCTAESDPHDVNNAIRRRIPDSLSTLYLRLLKPTETALMCLTALATLKEQGEFPALKAVHLNFCLFSTLPWFPPILYDDIEPIAREGLGAIYEKAGLELEIEQTD